MVSTADRPISRRMPGSIRNATSREANVLVYDFFSGCGGSSHGLRAAGLEPVFALDMDREALTTYEINFPSATVVAADIREFDTEQLAPYVPSDRRSPILFSACAPCQPFSKQNRQKRLSDDRVSLLSQLERFLDRYLPELVLVENVPGIQDFDECEEGPLARFVAALDRLGYYHHCEVVQAQDYGVPQNRRRLVVMASLLGPISHPPPTHGPGRLPYETVRTAIGSFPPLSAGERDESVPNHYACRLSDLNLQRIRATKEGGGRQSWREDLRLDCHREVKGYTDVYGRMHWDRPSPALTTRCVSLSNGRFGHPEQDRAISIREAASLQTFDMKFIFSGSVNSMAKQIGNAVPPRLAEIVGRAFLNHVTASTALLDG